MAKAIKNERLTEAIFSVYKNESKCAEALGWPRQKLNKIVNGNKEPTVEELNEIAKVIKKSVGEVVSFFLPQESPNRQQTNEVS